MNITVGVADMKVSNDPNTLHLALKDGQAELRVSGQGDKII
jgi:hypothetical protein